MPVIAPRKSMAPWIKDEVVYYPHQIQGVRWCMRRRSFLLADDMGLGKSLQAMTVFAGDVFTGRCETAIVVCPTGLKDNWYDEFEKFSSIRPMILAGTPKVRESQIREFMEQDGPRVLIVNYEQVKPHLDWLNAIRFDVAIFDECHYLKNYKSQRTVACLKLFSRRSFMLTGTPMLNRVNELWTILHRINPDEFPSYWKFTHRYCKFGGYKDKEIVGVKNGVELQLILDKYMIRRMKDKVLDLPPVQIIQRRVTMLPEQKKIYDQIVDEMRVEVNGEMTDVENSLTKYLRLKQLLGTTLSFSGEDYSAKLDLACEEDAEVLDNGNKLVVFTQFRSVQEAYIARMEAQGYKCFQLHGGVPINQRQEVVKTWEAVPNINGKGAILVCMLQVAGIGLNMTAAQHCTFLDKLYVPGLNQQAIDRLNRIGQEGASVQVREYIVKGTVENRVEAINRTKKALNEDIIGTGDDTPWKSLIKEAMAEEMAA